MPERGLQPKKIVNHREIAIENPTMIARIGFTFCPFFKSNDKQMSNICMISADITFASKH